MPILKNSQTFSRRDVDNTIYGKRNTFFRVFSDIFKNFQLFSIFFRFFSQIVKLKAKPRIFRAYQKSAPRIPQSLQSIIA